MRQVLSILFGAVFTISMSAALGSLLLRRLRVSLLQGEAALFGFLAGAACTSLLTFLLCLIGQARWSIFLFAGAVAIGAALWRGWPRPGNPIAGLKHKYALYYLIFTVYFVIYFINALAPEASPDGSSYHLGNVAHMWHSHGFAWNYHSMYAYLTQGLEMLFLVAFAFGRHSSATLIHFTFEITLALLIICYGRRFGCSRGALFAAVLVFASPVAGKAGSSAYNDLAEAALIFAVFYLLQAWNENRERNLLYLIGLLSGFAYSVKYTAALALLYAAGFLWVHSPVHNRRRNLTIFISAAAVAILPWVLRNWIWLGNPLAPFANRWFPNPYFHPGMEAMYLSDLSQYPGVRHWWEIPWQLLVRGRVTSGLLGPLFVLAPVALLALRHRQGRQLLVAAALFAIPAWFNTGARFLIPALPFVSLALGLALETAGSALVVIALVHAIAGLPPVSALYADRNAWRVASFPIAAALRFEPESKYLTEHLKDYSMKAAIETLTPPNAKIFSLDSVPQAYINRTFLIGYESALGNFGMDLLATPLDRNLRPSERQRFRFLPVATRGVRVVETADEPAFWAVNEIRVYRQGRELPRSGSWRVSAWPNGWDAQLAFDNSYATRWSSWQSMCFGMSLSIDFGQTQVIDEVILDHAPVASAKVQVEVMDDRSRWVPLTDSNDTSPLDTPAGLRRAASLALRTRGIGYLLVHDSDFFAADLRRYESYWGVTELHRGEHASLYLINLN